jgi:hypothetical protein
LSICQIEDAELQLEVLGTQGAYLLEVVRDIQVGVVDVGQL